MNHANHMPPSADHRHGERFRNPWQGATPHGFGGFIKWMLTRSEDEGSTRLEDKARPTPAASNRVPEERSDELATTWIGHSSFLIQCRGLTILTDPIWSDHASPVSFAGPRRLVPPGVTFENLPPVDITLISHDHYDHLDDTTIRRLVDRFPRMKWMAPLRVGDFLRKRGAFDVTELDWWDQHESSGLTFGCTPAQHFSGRYPWNRNATLWCGWTVRFDDDTRIFFAGDTGYHPEFRNIANRFGPFEIAILPIGAYEPRWFMKPVHMSPEEAVTALQDLDVSPSRCVMVGSHWGTFRLTTEPVMEPPRRTREAWSAASLPADRLWIMSHGETKKIRT